MDYLQRRLRESGAATWERIAERAGVSPRLPAKIAYGDRDNPRIGTIQPLLDFFDAVDRGECDLPRGDEPRRSALAAGRAQHAE